MRVKEEGVGIFSFENLNGITANRCKTDKVTSGIGGGWIWNGGGRLEWGGPLIR